MIDSTHPIELDGIKYRLAESAEGAHHVSKGEPLRPPNAVTVQGESSQEFQPRPDVLLWNWTNWSEGEGRRKLALGESGRSWQLNGVRAFEEPGHLIPGYAVEITQDTTGSSDLAKSLTLVTGIDNLYGLDRIAANVYLWDADNNKWGSATALTGVSAGSNDTAIGDTLAIYWVERNTQKVWKWNGSDAPETISTGTIWSSAATHISQLDDYVYVYRSLSGKVWEIAKAGGSTITIDEWTEEGPTVRGVSDIARLDGRIYVLVAHRNRTVVREITPTSAAGTGFGAEIISVDGFQADALWAHSGTLWLLGRYQTAETNRTILYLTPSGANFGTLGEIRDGETLLTGSGAASRMLDYFWVQRQRSAADTNHALFQVDTVSGGVSNIAYDEIGDATGKEPVGPVAFDGDIFWSVTFNASTKRIMRARKDRYTTSSNAISPEHDFDLASPKYLGSLVLSCKALIANWTIYVDYQTDNSGSWTTGITYTTDGGTGETVAISTDSSTVEFNILQLRIRMLYTGGGIPTSAPVVHGVEARAGVTTKVRIFDLLLDLSDAHSGTGQSRSGASKVDEFLATAVKTAVLDFKDGYTDRQAGAYDQYDMVVDEYTMVMDRPGEGVGAITLREVV